MTKYEEMKKDRETLRKRNIEIALTDAEAKDLCREAARRNTTPEQLIEDFIANLTDSSRSSGSDERMLAYEYVERCHYSYSSKESFLQWLIEYGGENAVIEYGTLPFDEKQYGYSIEAQEARDRFKDYLKEGGEEKNYDAAFNRIEKYIETIYRMMS